MMIERQVHWTLWCLLFLLAACDADQEPTCTLCETLAQPPCSSCETDKQPTCSSCATDKQPPCTSCETDKQPSCSSCATDKQPSCSSCATDKQPSCSSCATDKQPLSCTASKIKVSINSHRNETGQWVSQIQHDPSNSPATGRWNVQLEERTRDCEDDTSLIIDATITSPPPRGGPGYEQFPGVGNYKFHNTPITWDEAENICKKEGAHLAIINSEAESEVLRKLFARHPKMPDAYVGAVSIGFHDKYVEGEYITVFGEPLSSTGFISWSTDGAIQPDNDGGSDTDPGEDCGSMHTDGLLNDVRCEYKMPFICEQEL